MQSVRRTVTSLPASAPNNLYKYIEYLFKIGKIDGARNELNLLFVECHQDFSEILTYSWPDLYHILPHLFSNLRVMPLKKEAQKVFLSYLRCRQTLEMLALSLKNLYTQS